MILHLIETSGPGGAEQMLLKLADEYEQRGFSQLVCLLKDGWLAEKVRQRKIPLEIIPMGRLPDFHWLFEMAKVADHYGVRAIHAHEFTMNICGALLARWLKIYSVATVHGKNYYGDKWARRLAYRVISRITNIIAVSEDIRFFLIGRVGIDPSRVVVISNGINIQHFQFNEAKRRTMREYLNIKDNQVLLGTVGSYYPVKGHRFLIEAMQILVDIEPNVKLVIAGQGPLSEELQNQANDQGLTANVQITGYIEDTVSLLSAIDIFVMPSLSEGQPLALLEAAANGRCIVATDVGGIPEIITDTENGLLVPPGDAKALAEKLTGLLIEPDTRMALAAKAEKQANSNWSISRSADDYLSFLFPEKIEKKTDPQLQKM